MKTPWLLSLAQKDTQTDTNHQKNPRYGATHRYCDTDAQGTRGQGTHQIMTKTPQDRQLLGRRLRTAGEEGQIGGRKRKAERRREPEKRDPLGADRDVGAG